MDKDEILERVCEVVSDVLGVNLQDVTAESRFVEDLGAESIQSVELVAAFEEEFDIELDEEAALQVQTVGKAVDFIAEGLERQAAQEHAPSATRPPAPARRNPRRRSTATPLPDRTERTHMNVIITKDYEAASSAAADVVIAVLKEKARTVLGLATGSTPEGLYRRLIEANKNGDVDFSKVISFNLDEYVGLAPDHPQGYRSFMNEKLFKHVNIKVENTHVPDGLSKALLKHCRQYEEMIKKAGGVDVQVLGIGRDGHIGFNEPGTSLGSRTHVTALTAETIEDNARFFASAEDVPRFAVTMGIGTILESRKCLLIATGANKADAVQAALEGPVTSQVAASALQLHPDSVFVLDEAAARKLSRLEFYRWQQDNWHRIADKL